MAISVVAVLVGKPGAGREIIRAFHAISPIVHLEPGCELYAAHLERDGDTVVMVERWSTRDDLDNHAQGLALRRLTGLIEEHLVAPYNVWFLDAVPLGDPAKGVIPRVIS